MPFALTFFGLFIAVFQTLILVGIYKVKLKPKWLLFAITPITIFLSSFFGEKIGFFIVLIHFASIFIMVIFGMILVSFSNNNTLFPNRIKENTPIIEQSFPTLPLFHPAFGVIYHVYIILVIVLHIFIPNSNNLNTEIVMNDFFSQFYFQIFCMISLLIFSVTFFLTSKIQNLEKDYLQQRISNKNLKPFFSNNMLTLYVVLAGILVFNYLFDIPKNFPTVVKEFSNLSIYNLYFSLLIYFIYQIILIINNPKEATLFYIKKAVFTFKSGYLGLFLAAALVPVFIFIDSELDYFNMSSEIVLFLGFNIVVLTSEIMIYKRMKNDTLTTSKL